ncbi:MoaD/ThiS family protein [uncultured Methanomethylovorans sp.]|uniref:MoaD/ThiS family protein n=1 Tax=uncultured Methanomethylovorans sp. TaxID=183759 RepID=UPI002AA719FE|nr:MoaD/ThiS family protein [uncultured Methanomethylovorans sp.]
MKVKLPSGETEEIEISSTRVDRLLHQLGINQSSVIVVMNDQIIPEDTTLCNEDELQIIRVVYGG